MFRIYRDPDPAVPPPAASGDGTTIQVDHKVDPPVYTPPDIKMADALPPDLRDKPYFKDKSFVDVVKEHANLQTLLGQRPAGIPKEDASDEEWGKFVGAIKPKADTDYVFPETDFSKANTRSPEYEKAVRGLLFEAGIPKKMAGKVVQGIEGFLAQAQGIQTQKFAEAQKVRETEFEGLLDSTYKDQKQVVIDRTKKLMTEAVDPSLKEKVSLVLKDIPNDTLFALTAVLDGVYKKYVAEDNPPGSPDGTSGDAVSWQAEAEKIMSSPEYSDFRRPGHDQSKQRVQELFQKIASVRK